MSPTSVARWVRLRARPVDEEASKTKRSGQNFKPLKKAKKFWVPQGARSDNPEVVGSSPAYATMYGGHNLLKL